MSKLLWKSASLVALLISLGSHVLAGEPQVEVSTKLIWDKAPHNAFTDLIRHDGKFYCVFREGKAHVSPDGALRVITSSDGEKWESTALVTSKTADLRDAKITKTPDGQLMLNGAAATQIGKRQYTWQSFAWFSKDGRDWGEGVPIGDKDYWLWRSVWHKGTAYGIAYGCRDDIEDIRLYNSRDGRHYDTLVKKMYDKGYPTEAALVFRKDDTCLCLLRRDGRNENSALLGTSHPPYTDWTWKDLKKPAGGPQMLELPDGRLVAAVRLYDAPVRTSLCWVDPVAGTLTEFQKLPSGGDTSYPGMVWHDNTLWVSYYSSHEKKTNIYLSKVRFFKD